MPEVAPRCFTTPPRALCFRIARSASGGSRFCRWLNRQTKSCTARCLHRFQAGTPTLGARHRVRRQCGRIASRGMSWHETELGKDKGIHIFCTDRADGYRCDRLINIRGVN